jgi:hypothetical protein
MIELSPRGRDLAEAFIARLESMTQPLIAGWTEEREGSAVGILSELAEGIDEAAKVRRGHRG